MVVFILKRLGAGVVIAFVISFITYLLLYSSSSSIARNILGESASAEQVEAKAAELGLDQPLFTRYLDWLGSALGGDLGTSWFTSQPVATVLASRLPITLVLVITAIVLTAILATVLGIAAAVRRGWVDRFIQSAAVIGDAIPGFVLAIIIVTIFAVNLGWFPATSTISPGAGPAAWVASLTLAIIALTVGAVTSGAQQIRSAIIKQREKDYVRTLRSRGISEGEILFKNVLRSAAPAGLTVLSLQLIGMLGGTVIIEQIFALPGMGAIAVASTVQGDIPIVMGVVMYTVIIVVVVNLLVDLANGWLNPKVRVS
jgi:peptide/nickel transport system permease protein